MASITMNTQQVRAFRARRTLLTEPGAEHVAGTARHIIGLQAQVDSCAIHALSMRCAERPDAASIKRVVLEDRALVRTWGQRDTLHLYASDDLPWIIAARGVWKQTGRRGGMPSDELLDDMAAVFEDAGDGLVRSDLIGHIPGSYVDELRDHPGAGTKPERFAASRIIWLLARRGDIVFGPMAGKERAYVWRASWLPGLEWVEHDAIDACQELTRRYLSVFGPATPKDVAHYMGAKVTDARAWMKSMAEELVQVEVPGKKELAAMAEDADELVAGAEPWPARLLPAYDTVLMGHADKRWILPDAGEEKAIWKKAAVVSAVAVDRGVIVATWAHKKRTRAVDVTLSPMTDWDTSMREDLEGDAERFAAHLGLELGSFEVA